MKKALKGHNLSTTINNFELSYDDLGEGEVPVIFLHGFPFDKTMWKVQLDFLKPTNRVIACDIRGFGKSKDEVSSLSIDLFANDLIKFMDKLNIEQATICGLSMGGFIALNALQRFPSRFNSVILCDTQCIADTPEIKEKRYQTINKITVEGVTNFNEEFITNVFHKDSLRNKTKIVEQLTKVVFANSQHIITMGLTALAERSETCSKLSDVSIPTLIICGREDKVTPLTQSEFMNANIKGSTLHVIGHSGHVSNLEHPNEFNRELLDFLNAISHVAIGHYDGNKWAL